MEPQQQGRSLSLPPRRRPSALLPTTRPSTAQHDTAPYIATPPPHVKLNTSRLFSFRCSIQITHLFFSRRHAMPCISSSASPSPWPWSLTLRLTSMEEPHCGCLSLSVIRSQNAPQRRGGSFEGSHITSFSDHVHLHGQHSAAGVAQRGSQVRNTRHEVSPQLLCTRSSPEIKWMLSHLSNHSSPSTSLHLIVAYAPR
jgi:hypothetical protein